MEEEFDHKLFRWIGGKDIRFTPEMLSIHIYNETNSLFSSPLSLSSIRHRITCRLKASDAPILLSEDGFLEINTTSLSYRTWYTETNQTGLFSEETLEAVWEANQTEERQECQAGDSQQMLFDFFE